MGGICLQEVPACGSAHVKGGGAAGVVNLGMRGVPAGTMMKSPAIGNGRRCPPLEGVHLREASACGSVHLKGGGAAGVAARWDAPL